MKFSVWAPRAKQVDLCAANERLPMIRNGDGRWEVDAPLSSTPVRYRYSVDGGPPLPDPCSRWQPDGVHGDSWCGPLPAAAALRAPAFRPVPLHSAVIYELHVGTFTPGGTYLSAQAKLPHLVALGITHVELMPIATFPGNHGWGYDGTYLFAPHPAYGSPAELAAFVDACHAHGLAVLLDVVYNHLGPDGNFLPSYAPCFTSRWKTPWGEAINFDGAGSDGMRRLVLENITYWILDYGFDGLRLDAVHEFCDARALPILEEIGLHVAGLGRTLKRDLVVIAESDLNDPRLIRPREQGGFALDGHWADDFHHSLHAFLTGERDGYYGDYSGLGDLARALRAGYVYQGQYSAYRERGHGRPPEGIHPEQLVVCAQNHDQVGNRARGERLSMLVSPGRLKAAAALTLLSPYVPLLFQGEEWGARTPFLYFTDHRDPDLAVAVSKGRRKEFAAFAVRGAIPDPQEPSTFTRSRLRWDELGEAFHADMLGWHRSLIALRKEIGPGGPPGTTRPESAVSTIEVHFDEVENWLTLQRHGMVAAFNFARSPRKVPLPDGDWRIALDSSGAPGAADGAFPAECTRIFRRSG